MSRRKKYASVIIPAVSLFLLLFLFLLSGLISLGQQLNSVSPILAWLYGLIVLACLGAGIIWPIVSVWRHPIFSMYMLRYRDGRARFYWCRKLTDNLKKNTELTNEETARLEDFLKQGNQADDLLIDFFYRKVLSCHRQRDQKCCKDGFCYNSNLSDSFLRYVFYALCQSPFDTHHSRVLRLSPKRCSTPWTLCAHLKGNIFSRRS